MSLRSKTLLILAGVVGLYGSVNYATQRSIIQPSFVTLEREEAVKDLQRCVEAIRREIMHLGTTCEDYASWDDTCAFVVDANREYAEANIAVSNLQDLDLNVMVICDTTGTIIGRAIVDIDSGEPLEIPEFATDRLPASHVLVHHPDEKSQVSGVVLTANGPMFVASAPILTNMNEGPVRGAFITGRLLTDAVLGQLREQTKLDFGIIPIKNATALLARPKSPAVPSSFSAIRIAETSEMLLDLSTELADVWGQPALAIHATIPREITARGRAALRLVNLLIVVAGFVTFATLAMALEKTVLTPIARLTAHATTVGRTDDVTARLSLGTRDELERLADAMNRMVEGLADARAQLVEQSYQTGMAEMAAGTLHNVRNALTPVLADIELLRQELRGAAIEEIEQAWKELTDETVLPERKADLARFVELASDNLTAVARRGYVTLDHVAGCTYRIEQLLAEQEAVCRTDCPMESVRMADLVNGAVALLPENLRDRITVEITPRVQMMQSVRTHRKTVLRILVNLLTNAAESIEAAGRHHGHVQFDATIEPIDNGTMVHLCVRDDGVGIAPDHREHVFERGFSTKKEGGGIGLHWCANAVAGLDGQMLAESDGAGRGACLHVWIPGMG